MAINEIVDGEVAGQAFGKINQIIGLVNNTDPATSILLVKSGGNYTTTAGITASSFTETSSIRYKQNVAGISNALDTVSLLRGVTFDRKDGTAQNEAGVIAEELFSILPNLIQMDEDGNPNSVYYTRIIAYLIEAVKELKAEVDELKGDR